MIKKLLYKPDKEHNIFVNSCKSYASLLYGGIDYDTIEQIDLNDVIENDSFNYEISNIRSILESQYNAKVSIKYLPETLLEVKEIQSLLETSEWALVITVFQWLWLLTHSTLDIHLTGLILIHLKRQPVPR